MMAPIVTAKIVIEAASVEFHQGRWSMKKRRP
jgi:hypothetical protein